MNGAGEIDFTLDVDHLTFADADIGRNPGWVSERIIAEPHHRQAIDLAGAAAAGVNQDRAALNRFVQTLANAIHAIDARVDGMLDIVPGDQVALGFACPMVRLSQQVCHLAQLYRELLGIFDLARRLFDNSCHRAAVERQQLIASCQGRNQPRIHQVCIGIALHVVSEIHGHLEQFAKLGIVGGQQVVQQRFSHQHDLDVERNGFRLQGNCADETERLSQGLDAQLAG